MHIVDGRFNFYPAFLSLTLTIALINVDVCLRVYTVYVCMRVRVVLK